MKKFKVEYIVWKNGKLVDESRIFVEAENATEAENKAYDQLDDEYEGVGRVKVQDVR